MTTTDHRAGDGKVLPLTLPRFSPFFTYFYGLIALHRLVKILFYNVKDKENITPEERREEGLGGYDHLGLPRLFI